MAARKKEPNVWKKNVNYNRGDNLQANSPTPAEVKFKEAHGKLQAAVRKHVQDYESSSEEEELESENIFGLFY